jgi:mannose-6-phosphate isomerase-like protein (cupin superfamily)
MLISFHNGEPKVWSASKRKVQLGPNSLLIFEPGERHSIRAEDEDLVFVAFLHGASSWQ